MITFECKSSLAFQILTVVLWFYTVMIDQTVERTCPKLLPVYTLAKKIVTSYSHPPPVSCPEIFCAVSRFFMYSCEFVLFLSRTKKYSSTNQCASSCVCYCTLVLSDITHVFMFWVMATYRFRSIKQLVLDICT